ncbi:MAG: hypothetical protein IJ436_04240 [Bacteroidaceae bacterium]|nr:hypothetical protein [Bacteroidaceae bacterium]
MGMNFFERIANLINGNKAENISEVTDSSKYSQNAINKNALLLERIVSVLKSNYAGIKVSMIEKSLTLCVNDALFYDSLMLSNFKEQLITTIIDELGLEFGSVEIKDTKPVDSNWVEVMDNCFLLIETIRQKQMVHRAVISTVAGYGSILDGCLTLDSQEIQKLPNSRYNIGVGRQPRMSDGSHRVNQIAIDDNPDSPEYNNNKYVSRAHAYISYSDKCGFMLCVELSGTRAAQKRTHIYRGANKIELNNTLIPEQLHDGDYIVLSKYVHLLFKKV